jgi:hypothetical protein
VREGFDVRTLGAFPPPKRDHVLRQMPAAQAIGMLRDDDLPGPELLPSLAAQFEHDHGIPCRTG